MHITGSRAWFDEYNYRDSLQAQAIEGIGYCLNGLHSLRINFSHCFGKVVARQRGVFRWRQAWVRIELLDMLFMADINSLKLCVLLPGFDKTVNIIIIVLLTY